MWLIDCYWHMLFCFMLLIIMIIWRPSANKLRYVVHVIVMWLLCYEYHYRFAYSQVHNGDSEDEEQGANQNFGSLLKFYMIICINFLLYFITHYVLFITETVKMRPVSKLDMTHKPVTSTEAVCQHYKIINS